MYKISKQSMSIGLCFVLALSSLGMPFSIHSTAKVKLSKTKLSMTVGQKKKITIKGKKKKATYRFSSSSRKKATVSKNGMVTAKKKGTVKITVKEKIQKENKKGWDCNGYHQKGRDRSTGHHTKCVRFTGTDTD